MYIPVSYNTHRSTSKKYSRFDSQTSTALNDSSKPHGSNKQIINKQPSTIKPRRCSNLSVVLLEDPADDALPALLDPRRLHAHVLERHRLLRPAHQITKSKLIN